MTPSSTTIEACARAAHEANRAYCITLGDLSQPSWDDAPDWQKTSARNGVIGALNGATPEQSHESWLAEKAANGWKWGPVKNPDAKEHPCFVAYHDLPSSQRAKDLIFVSVVRAVGAALEPAEPIAAETSSTVAIDLGASGQPLPPGSVVIDPVTLTASAPVEAPARRRRTTASES